MVNTTKSVHGEPRGTREEVTPNASPAHMINTSDLLEPPQMVYEDEEPEIAQVLSAIGWMATFEDGTREELLFWVVDGAGEVYGVTVPGEGRIDLGASVEEQDGFQGYIKLKEEK